MPKLTRRTRLGFGNGAEVAFAEKFAENMVELFGASLEDTLSENHFPPASDPGEVPHRRTGQLATSWEVVQTATGVGIRSRVPYAGYLERGTAQMDARPFVGKSFERVIERLNFTPAEFRDIVRPAKR